MFVFHLIFLLKDICCLYVEPTAYGIVTMKFSVREGINIFLAGFVPTENMGLRDYELYYQEIISVKKNDQMYIIKIKYN